MDVLPWFLLGVEDSDLMSFHRSSTWSFPVLTILLHKLVQLLVPRPLQKRLLKGQWLCTLKSKDCGSYYLDVYSLYGVSAVGTDPVKGGKGTYDFCSKSSSESLDGTQWLYVLRLDCLGYRIFHSQSNKGKWWVHWHQKNLLCRKVKEIWWVNQTFLLYLVNIVRNQSYSTHISLCYLPLGRTKKRNIKGNFYYYVNPDINKDKNKENGEW